MQSNLVSKKEFDRLNKEFDAKCAILCIPKPFELVYNNGIVGITHINIDGVINIPDYVSHLYSFTCSNKRLQLNNIKSIEIIHDEAFKSTTFDNEIKLSNIMIEKMAFVGCSFTSLIIDNIKIPDGGYPIYLCNVFDNLTMDNHYTYATTLEVIPKTIHCTKNTFTAWINRLMSDKYLKSNSDTNVYRACITYNNSNKDNLSDEKILKLLLRLYNEPIEAEFRAHLLNTDYKIDKDRKMKFIDYMGIHINRNSNKYSKELFNFLYKYSNRVKLCADGKLVLADELSKR